MLWMDLAPETASSALVWIGLCEVPALVLGIIGWRSGTGKGAVIAAVLLTILYVPLLERPEGYGHYAQSKMMPGAASQNISFGPVIESVVVSVDKAVIKQRNFHGEGMSVMFGPMTNRWEPSSLYLDAMFDLTLESPWFRRDGANWVFKSRHGTYTDYRLNGPSGPMLGKIVFHPGKPAPEADGFYVIAEFRRDMEDEAAAKKADASWVFSESQPGGNQPIPIAVRLATNGPVPPPATGASGFGPVMERVVNCDGTNSLIDLDSGRLFTPPPGGADWNWHLTNGIDAFDDPAKPPRPRLWATSGTVVVPAGVSAWAVSAWEKFTVGDVRRIVVPLSPTTPGGMVMDSKGELPATFVFKTREGGMGILQILGNTTTGDVKIRYKLVQDESKNVSAATQHNLFIVKGRVVDEQGNGLGGVKITAHCGMGTLQGTGETFSGVDGSYTLRFGPGMWMADSNTGPWHIGFQAVTISPAKHGYFDANLNRQGDLLMSDHLPAQGEKTGWKVDTNKLVLPDRPLELNFVLLPAAKITGRLHDENGASLTNWDVRLVGEQLPPSSDVFDETDTDAEGHFQLADLPTTGRWGLTARRLNEWKERGAWTDFRSEEFSLSKPSVYDFDVERNSTDKSSSLAIRYKLVQSAATNTQPMVAQPDSSPNDNTIGSAPVAARGAAHVSWFLVAVLGLGLLLFLAVLVTALVLALKKWKSGAGKAIAIGCAMLVLGGFLILALVAGVFFFWRAGGH